MLLFILRQIFRIIASFLGCSETNSWGPNCTTPCNCGVGASSCDPIVGCVCQQGWNGTLCDTNINECLTSPCNASQVCVDNPGSYTCTCSSGFQSDQNGGCQGEVPGNQMYFKLVVQRFSVCCLFCKKMYLI